MSDSAKRFFERAAYVVFFAAAVFVVRIYKESRKPISATVPINADILERTRNENELRKRMADLQARETAGHAARVQRLGEAGAKAQEDRCDAELMAAFKAAVDKQPAVKTPSCGE